MRRSRRITAILSPVFLLLAPVSGAAPATHPAVLLALRFASEKLEAEGCRGVYRDFADETGRPLAGRLDELGLSPAEHLATLSFEDSDSDPLCRGAEIMAFTSPRSPIVHVCTSRFARRMQAAPAFGAASILHEQLHTLGLLENPPTSGAITARVLQRCGR